MNKLKVAKGENYKGEKFSTWPIDEKDASSSEGRKISQKIVEI